MKLFLLISMFTINVAMAEVKFIEKDKPAPYSGFLFSPTAELENRLKLMDLEYFKNLTNNQNKLIDLKNKETELLAEQVKLWKDQSESLSKELTRKENYSFWKNLLYFGLGAAITTTIVFGVNKASK